MAERHGAAAFGRGVAWNLGGQAFAFAASFALVPFVVHRLGEADYALYGLLGLLSGYLTLAAFGAGMATTRGVSEASARADSGAMRLILRRSLLMHSAAPAAAAAALFLLRGPAAAFLAPASGGAGLAAWVVGCAAAGGAFFSLNQFCASVFHGLQRFDLLNKSQFAQSAGFLLITAGLAASGRGLREAAVAYPLFQAVLCAAQLPVALRSALGRTGGPAAPPAPLGGYLRFCAETFLSQVAWTVAFQLDKTLVVRVLPLAHAAYYMVPSFLLQKFWVLPMAVTTTAFPALAGHAGRGDAAAARRVYEASSRLVLLSVMPAFVMLAVLGPQFLTVWMGSDFSLHGVWPLRLLAAGYLFNLLGLMPNTASLGLNRARNSLALNVGQAALTAAAWAVLVPRWGAVGAAGGFLVGQAFSGLPFALYVNATLFGIGAREYAVTVLLRPLAAALALALALWPLRGVAWGWPGLFALGAASAAAYYALSFALLSAEDKASAGSVVASLRARVLG